MINAILFALVGLFMFVGTSVAAIGVENTFFRQHTPDVAADVVTVTQDQTPQGIVPATKTSVVSSTVINCDTSQRDREDDEDDNEDREDEDEDEDRSVENCVTTSVAQATPSVAPTAPKPTTQPATQAPGTFTMAQVAAHNSAASCYSVISGSVYNLTSFVSQHPGGSAAIKSLCGVDGTAAYNNQHGGARRPTNELAPLKIGSLTQ